MYGAADESQARWHCNCDCNCSWAAPAIGSCAREDHWAIGRNLAGASSELCSYAPELTAVLTAVQASVDSPEQSTASACSPPGSDRTPGPNEDLWAAAVQCGIAEHMLLLPEWRAARYMRSLSESNSHSLAAQHVRHGTACKHARLRLSARPKCCTQLLPPRRQEQLPPRG